MGESITNSYGQRRRIHLYHQPRMTKSRGRVDYYSLATCLFEDGKNKKKILQSIGPLSKEEADQYRLLLKSINGQIDIKKLTNIDEIIYEEDKHYLDVLLLNNMWEHFGFDKIFEHTSSLREKVSVQKVAQILTINRLLDPCSKIRSIPWLKTTMLPKILKIDEDSYEKNRIFRSLEKIHKCKNLIEKSFFSFSQKNCGDYEVYYFDGSTSWFEGTKCALAKYDMEKSRGFNPQVIGLMMLTDKLGFPVAWEVVDGNKKDTVAIKDFIKRVKEDYQVKQITYCFDRGVASVDNFDIIAESGNKFISGIRDNQIQSIFDIEKFQSTRARIVEYLNDDEPTPKAAKPMRTIAGIGGFFSLNKKIYFKDLGVISGKRYIVSFNSDLFEKETSERQQKIHACLNAVADKNLELALAKRDRDYNATERDLLAIMSSTGCRSFYDYTLLPLTASNKSQSFKIELELKKDKLHQAQLTDGILVYVTDHTEKNERGAYKLTAQDIIAHYKAKYVIENSFRELKSFLDLRPFYVWSEQHVKAHYDIAVMAYFIRNYIYRALQHDGTSVCDFFALLKNNANAIKIKSPAGVSVFKMKQVPQKLKECITAIGAAKILSPELHTSHCIFQ